MPEKPENNPQTDELLEEINTFVQAANPIVDVERAFRQKARDTLDEVNVLEQADEALVQAAQPEPGFVPPKELQGLFDEVNALVDAQNVLDEASLHEDHHLRHVDRDLREPGEYNPESVIDERIKEEQKQDVQDAFKDELADAL